MLAAAVGSMSKLGAAAATGARRGLAATAGLACGAHRDVAGMLAAGTRLPSYAPRGARMMAAAAFGTADVRQAAQLLQKGYKYLDVRTPEEFAGGHAPGALNVPYMNAGAAGMTPNPAFLAGCAGVINKKDCQVLVGCKSGARSSKAATALSDAGYSGLIDVEGGFSAWEAANLPVEK